MRNPARQLTREILAPAHEQVHDRQVVAALRGRQQRLGPRADQAHAPALTAQQERERAARSRIAVDE
jgi:hypothetical protein